MEQEKPIVTAELYDKYSKEFPDLKVGEELPEEILAHEAAEVKAVQEKAAEDEKIAADKLAAEEKQAADDAAAAASAQVTAKEPELTYRGLKVISNGTRTVGERTLRHIKCEDGTTYDLSEEDYEREVKAL